MHSTQGTSATRAISQREPADPASRRPYISRVRFDEPIRGDFAPDSAVRMVKSWGIGSQIAIPYGEYNTLGTSKSPPFGSIDKNHGRRLQCFFIAFSRM